MSDRYIRSDELLEITGLAKSTIYFKIKNGTFPPPTKISHRASGWLESKVDTWKQDPANYNIKGGLTMTSIIQKPVRAQDGTVTPKIRSMRQYRALKYLSEHRFATCFELQRIVGARNIPDIIGKLRKYGWWLICERFEIADRDGKLTRPGKYHLEVEQLPIAKQVLNVWEESHDTTRGA